jgi:ABC-type multidrug transport system fused ATPase/permease subunit
MHTLSSTAVAPLPLREDATPVNQQHLVPRLVAAAVPAALRRVVARLHATTSNAAAAAGQRIHQALITRSLLYQSCFSRVRALPITEFYLYMWRVDPALFVNTMFVNYGLPVLMEAAPWYLSRRKISRLLRESRNSITHRLVANEAFSDTAIGSFVLFSLVYALVQTVEQVLRTRVLLANRLLIKRLVLERILYSELGSLQEKYHEVFGEEVRTEQLEMHVFNDISETLNLFNTTIPSLLRGAYTLVGSSHDLWLNREAFDVLAILRPSIVGLTSEAVNYVREKMIVDAQTLQQQKNASAMSRVVTNIVDGLAEIQTNNMQRFQLKKLDQVSGEELQNQQGGATFVNNIYRQVSNRSVFDFASEVYVVQAVMRRRNINHETYRKVQNDIDYVTRLFGRLWSQARDAHRVYETQERVIALLNLPSFIAEAKLRGQPDELNYLLEKERPAASEESASSSASAGSSAECIVPAATSPVSVAVASLSQSPIAPTPTFEFESLHFRRVVFRYKQDLPLALNIHVRVPGEAVPSLDDEIEDNSTHEHHDLSAPSSLPGDLRSEIEAVLAHPRMPRETLRKVSLISALTSTPPLMGSIADDDDPHADADLNCQLNGHSAIMADMMSSQEPLGEDEEGNVINHVEDVPNRTERILRQDVMDDSLLTELDDIVTRHETENAKMEFQGDEDDTTAVVDVAPSRPPIIHPRLSLSLPSSLPSPSISPAPTSTCEPGTLLFERGKSYALIGENRSGKSTLMQILCKLYQPSDSDCDIQLNGDGDFMHLPRMLLRDRVSYVAQRPFIFPGTIEENIRIGNTQATNEEVESAAERAGIFSMEQPKPLTGSNLAPGQRSLVDRTGSMALVAKPWEQNRLKSVLLAGGGWLKRQWMRVHGFEEGEEGPTEEEEEQEERKEELAEADAEQVQRRLLESQSSVLSHNDSASAAPPSHRPIHPTLLLETAERGANLSGGFAQSVALARVFLRKDAQIIILDEAMGQMDAIKKRELIFPRLFEFVKKHRMTLILISHDVPLVCKLVDTVYVMHRGECVQSGTHRQLMADRSGAYARLVGTDEEKEPEAMVGSPRGKMDEAEGKDEQSY